MKYVVGLDIGIGSVGWSVVRNEPDCKRIEDFGVRVFDSGEIGKKDRKSQVRRRYRSARRLCRRRSHRKYRIKAYLEKIGLVKAEALAAFFESGKNDVISYRVKALDEKLTPCELAACIVNIAGKRGYRDFYEIDKSDLSPEEKKEYEAEQKATQNVSQLMSAGAYRSVAEMIVKDPSFAMDGRKERKYRNHAQSERTYLMPRTEIKKELALILDKQSAFYPCLDQRSREIITEIAFSQRDFEDGPGDVNDSSRKYSGFIDTLGACRFYKDEKRGSRFTAVADMYAVINAVSQYSYVNKKTGETDAFTAEMASDIVDFVLKNACIGKKEIKAIAKKHNVEVIMDAGDATLSKAVKFLKVAKATIENCGYSWEDFVADFDEEDGKLSLLGKVLAENITPHRRENALAQLGFLNDEAVKKFAAQKFSGTSSVSFKYMRDVLDGFSEGCLYGSFQANKNSELEQKEAPHRNLHRLLPPFDKDFEFYKNPVVCRAINETRKIINAIIRKYGSPTAINLEVASELNKCSEDRDRDEKEQKKRQKERDRIRSEIATTLNISEEQVTGVQIEKYMLYESQKGVCLYSGMQIKLDVCLCDKNNVYQIDHIIPFSLVLDNTINNKALVFTDENQLKRQRTPLEYLSGEKKESYLNRVNFMYKNKLISKKKYQYLLAPSVFDAGVMEGWKSRNLNDTRYIAKFLVSYLANELQFDLPCEGETYRQPVYAVKSAVTSMMRRQWLNENTWGVYEKEELKKVTYLDHAADAVVLANCLPAYVEIAMENNKLRNMCRNAGKKITDEYTTSLKAALTHICRFYSLPYNEVEKLLTLRSKTPSLVPNLRNEVEVRFVDPDIFRYFEKKEAIKRGEKPADYTDEQIEEQFRAAVKSFYSDDAVFAEKVRMPQTSYKIERKYAGAITADNAKRFVTIEGKELLLSRTSVLGINKNNLENIYTEDTDLLRSLQTLFEGVDKEDTKITLDILLKKAGKTQFVTEKGNEVNYVTIRSVPNTYLTKQISDINTTKIPKGEYYCVEFYKTKKDKLNARGILPSDLSLRSGKLCFKPAAVKPDDYKQHIMYVNKGEYIEVFDRKGNRKEKSGFYVSVKNINQPSFCTAQFNTPVNRDKRISIAATDSIRKINYDILGYRGGEIKCGEPLL